MRSARLLAVCAALLMALSAQAQAPTVGTVQLTHLVQKEVEVEEGGQKIKKLVEPGKLTPGDELVYTMLYYNDATLAAERVVVNNVVPERSRLRAASVEGEGTEISYSVDGGKIYGLLEQLGVETGKSADGKPITRPATEADVTHLRWVLASALGPRASGFVRFRSVLLE